MSASSIKKFDLDAAKFWEVEPAVYRNNAIGFNILGFHQDRLIQFKNWERSANCGVCLAYSGVGGFLRV